MVGACVSGRVYFSLKVLSVSAESCCLISHGVHEASQHNRRGVVAAGRSAAVARVAAARVAPARVAVVVVVVAVPQRIFPSKPAPLRKSKQLAGECHRPSGLLMLCCVLMCASAGQWVIMCVRLWVPVLQCVQSSSTESSILFR